MIRSRFYWRCRRGAEEWYMQSWALWGFMGLRGALLRFTRERSLGERLERVTRVMVTFHWQSGETKSGLSHVPVRPANVDKPFWLIYNCHLIHEKLWLNFDGDFDSDS
eukprot:1343656-Amorphochlora_amoeboformis.AAC.1